MSTASPSPSCARKQKVSARDQTLAILRRGIISLELAPGSPISENDLAARLGVSRTPVRESLIVLQGEGLVQVFPQLGTFVSRVDAGKVTQAQFVREAIECASLADAVGTAGEPSVPVLRRILEQQREADAQNDVEQFFLLDEAFHRELLRAGGHESAWATVNSAKAHLDRARRLSLITTRPVSALIDQHERIVDSLEAGDLDRAVTCLREHLRAVFEDVQRIREATPELFSDAYSDERPRLRVDRAL
jgi:DNA-binding GntR family transcriptional regulator